MLTLLRRNLLLTSALALAYFAAARIGLLLAIGPGEISAIWPASGLALAALMLLGRRAVAGLALGMFCANWFTFIGPLAGYTPIGAAAAATMTTADLVQAGLAARILADFPEKLRRNPVRQTLRFASTVLSCTLLSCTVAELALWSLELSQPAQIFFGWVTFWIGDATGMLVAAPGLLLLLHPRLRKDRLPVQAFPLVCLGLGVTIFSTFAVGIVDRDAHIERFTADTGRLAMTLQNHVELTGRDLETLQHHFSKVDLDAGEFRAVSRPLLARSSWQSTFAWLPRVLRGGRDAFETSPAGLDGMSIREVRSGDTVVRAGAREEYFPVAWTAPEAGRESLIGLDHANDVQRGSALVRARLTGRMAATPPLSAVANSPDGRVVQTLYVPINDKSAGFDRPYDAQGIRGMVAATRDLASLFQTSLDQMDIRDQTVLLYDPDAPGSVALRWRGGTVHAIDAGLRDRLVAQLASGVYRQHWLHVADRRWGLLAQPAWAGTMPKPSWLQLAVLASGLAFTTLLTGFMVIRRRRDEVLQGAHEQLEGQVQARTRDLATTNRRLLEEIAGHRHTESLLLGARHHAEAANRAKSLFLANMSHEIRTPLNAVLGYTQLLMEDRRQGSESRERLRIIYSAGQRLLGLINDVLDLAKIEAGALQVHVEPVDLRRELEEIGTLFAPRAAAKGLRLELDIDLDIDCALLVDRAKLGQIVLNLLGNALKFTDAGRIVLRAWRAAEETFVEVEDTGPGMDAHERAAVFTPFRQGSAGFDKGGTGLGLSLSLRIAEALGGELTIASVPGEGTRVLLRLPMTGAGAAAPAPPAFHGGQRLAAGTSCRVLVVEDDRHSRDVLATLLRDAGCEVVAAVDGEAGLAACRAMAPAAPFAIVFSDIRMPRLDGLRMLQALRADERTRRLPLIAVSASSLEHERRYYIGQGFQDFVSKPYDFESIYAMLALHAHAAMVAVGVDDGSVETDQPGVPGRGGERADAAGPTDAAAASPGSTRPDAAAAAAATAAATAAAAAQAEAARALLTRLADAAAGGAVSQARQALAALAALGPGALPDGLGARLESDLRLYDFTAIESRLRELLEQPGRAGAGRPPAPADVFS